MGVQRPSIIVSCDFPGCPNTQDTYVFDPTKIYNSLLSNSGWLRVDPGGFAKEFFCPTHKRWFESRTALPFEWGDTIDDSH